MTTSSAVHSGVRPPYLRGTPILGHMQAMFADQLALYRRLAAFGREQRSDVVQFGILELLTGKRYFVNNADAAKRVLQENHRNYGRHMKDYDLLRLILGEGLVASDGEFHRQQRRVIAPALRQDTIDGFIPLMVSLTQEMLDGWESREVVDIKQETIHLALQIVGKALINRDMSLGTDAIGRMFSEINDYLIRFATSLAFPPSVPTRRNRRFLQALHEWNKLVDQAIEDSRQSSAEDKQTKDLLTLLLNSPMSAEQLRNEVKTMMVAGHETTAAALQWVLYALASHTHVHAQVLQEVDTLGGHTISSVEDLERLPFLKQVILETLRLWPPVAGMIRQALEDDQLCGYHIPKGATLFIIPSTMHRHPAYWEQNPDEFVPERFAPARVQERHPFAYLPFGAGPHICIGMPFALTEISVILVGILQKYTLSLEPDYALREIMLATHQPLTLKMFVHKREH